MVTVKEYTFDEAQPAVKKLNLNLSPDERVLVMDEDGEIVGASIIGLDKTVVEIRAVAAINRPFAYYDLLARSTLNLINLFELPIMVRVEKSEYFKSFGFTEAKDGYMYVRSDEIVFKGSICGK